MISDQAEVTVFCAVWSGDEQRHVRLRGHQATLEAQDVAVEAVYVFDDGDEPPSWLRGRAVVSPEPLTIYEAWARAIDHARTPLVMNLNLDDRLRRDAVRLLAHACLDGGGMAAGGDWEVVYDQIDADRASSAVSTPARELPHDPAWPPPHGTRTRFGSGTGDRGSLGPASMWPRALHDTIPFPTRFGDGTPIRSIGDAIWWTLLMGALDRPLARVDRVVGHYLSAPTTQAEFRAPDEQEVLRRHGVDIGDGRIVLADRPAAPTTPDVQGTAGQGSPTVDTFGHLRGRHAGETCFVMGNGPSLNDMDLDLLDGHVVFGSNAAYLLYDRVDWRHRYYFACDSRVIPDHAAELVAMHEANPGMELFLPSVLHLWDGSGRVLPTERFVPRAPGRYHFRPIPLALHHLPWSAVSADMDQGLVMPFSVTINMIEAAVWMGFTRIVLVGCDTSYVVKDDVVAEGPESGDGRALLTSTSDDVNHFDPRYFGEGRRWHQPNPQRMVQHYAWARDAFTPRGVEILNGTVGGELEVFPRVDYRAIAGQRRGGQSASAAAPAARETSRATHATATQPIAPPRTQREYDAATNALPQSFVLRDFDPSGVVFEATNEVELYRIVAHGGETAYTKAMVDFLREDDVFYDVGANVGLVALHAAARCRTIAFEPDPEFADRLRHNLALNPRLEMEVRQQAVSDVDGRVELFTDGAAGNSPSLAHQRGEKGVAEVEARRLDTLVHRDGLPAPTVVKLDIEGAEILALRGGSELLSSADAPRALFIEVHDTFLEAFGATAADVDQLLYQYGYTLESYRAPRSDQRHLILTRTSTVHGIAA